MRKLFYPVALVLLIALTGCATEPKQDVVVDPAQAKRFIADPTQAKLFIYRDHHGILEAAVYTTLVVDGIQLGGLTNGDCYEVNVPPGKHTITRTIGTLCLDCTSSIDVQVDAGKVYFIEDLVGLMHTGLSQIEEAQGMATVSALEITKAPLQAERSIAGETPGSQPTAAPAKTIAAKIVAAPTPIADNSGKFMSPYTAAGAVAIWAQQPDAADNGSDLAEDVSGVVGEEVGKQALDFVPFGLGGVIGKQAGKAASRAATGKTTEPELPGMDIVVATSDISFNTADDLAVFMYAKYSTHKGYAKVLALTQSVYPELAQVYASAIEKAAQSPENIAQGATKPAFKKAAVREKLESLKELKGKGLITEEEFQAKRSKVLEAF